MFVFCPDRDKIPIPVAVIFQGEDDRIVRGHKGAVPVHSSQKGAWVIRLFTSLFLHESNPAEPLLYRLKQFCVYMNFIFGQEGEGGWYFLEICFKRTIIRLSKNVKMRFLFFPKKFTFLFETDILHSCSYLGLNIYKLTLLYRNFSNCENVVSFYLTNRLYSLYVNIYTVSQTKHLAFFY